MYKEEITINTLIIIFFIFVAFMWYVVYFNPKNAALDRFTDKLMVIGSIFIPIGIYLTYKVFSLQLDQKSRDATFRIIDRSWLNVNKSFIDYYNECPNFINSLYFDWQKKVLGKVTNYQKEDSWYSVKYICALIFQSWEDFITSSKVDETGDIVWINCFIPWCNSKLLKNNWTVLKSNYAPTTQELGDYMFYMINFHKPKNVVELSNLGALIVKSKKFREILYERFNR
jgi:hypothetical protein